MTDCFQPCELQYRTTYQTIQEMNLCTTPPAEKEPANNEPAPGASNGNGAVYDPVFGWIVPGNGQETIGDSDGDINKQVGNMG